MEAGGAWLKDNESKARRSIKTGEMEENAANMAFIARSNTTTWACLRYTYQMQCSRCLIHIVSGGQILNFVKPIKTCPILVQMLDNVACSKLSDSMHETHVKADWR